ncbi:MAG: TRAP transporter substrate-binding protein [Burkholderiales bacterium]
MDRHYAKKLSAVTLCAALLLPIAATAQTPELKFSSFPPPTGALNRDLLTPWIKEVNTALGSMASIRLFPGGTLGRDPVQQFKLVRDRVADLAYVVMDYTPGDFPDSNMFELPFVAENSVEGSVAHWRLVQRGVLRGYDKGKFLAGFMIPPQSLHTTGKLPNLAALKGQKVRAAGVYQAATIELLGATPVTGITIAAAAEALSRGVVTGVLSDWNGMVAFRIGDAAKNHYELPLGAAAAGIFMNTESYNALPPAARAIIDKYSGESFSRQHGIEFDRQHNENMERAKKQPEHVFLIPTAAERDEVKRRVQPVIDRWAKENPDGRKRLEALATVVEDIRKGR